MPTRGAIFIVVLFLLLLTQPGTSARAQEEEGSDTAQTETTATPTPSTKPAAEDEATAQLKKNAEDLAKREAELAQLNEKIAQLKTGQKNAATQAELAAGQVARLTGELQAAELRLKQASLTVAATNRKINEVTSGIEEAEQSLAETRIQLAHTVRALYEHDQTTIVDIVLSSGTLSSVLSDRRAYEALHERATALMTELREKQRLLAEQRDQLVEQKRELELLKAAEAYQQAEIQEKTAEQTQVLRLKQDEQARYERRIAEAEEARKEIERHVFTVKSTGLEIALNDAFSAARFASSRTGVRPALLLAILKVETNVGANLGSGVFPNDMHPDSREPFLRLMKKLDRDPFNTPMSRRPTSYQGWGGAIGPGQFMPWTWEIYEPRIGQLMGKPVPDPFALPDVLVGVGIMMADRGATNPTKEAEAVGRYLAGPNWMYHLWYSNRVLAVAEEYVREGLL